MTTKRIALHAAVFLICLGLALPAAANAAADPPKEFKGHFRTGIFAMVADGFHGIPMFMDPDRAPTIPASECKRSDALLQDVCAKGLELQKIPGLGRQLAAQTFESVMGKQIKEMLHIAVFTAQSVPVTSEIGSPYYFAPGPLTKLDGVIKKYGEPKEKELWTHKEFASWVGLNGTVNWWGNIGLAASPDGSITHILIREREEAKK